jgi:branched-subunit amino acid transport protein
VNRNPVRIGHLVMGILFAVFVALWALVDTDVVDHSQLRWLVPVPFLIAGVAGLAASALRQRGR